MLACMPQSQTRDPCEPEGAELCARGISKSFGERVVLSGINLTVKRGDMLSVVGGSGSGKTVLLHVLAGLIAADTGVVLVADHSREPPGLVDLNLLDEDSRDRVRLSWAVVFQRNALFSGTVYENIALLLREHDAMLHGEHDATLTEARIGEIARESLAAAALDVDDVLNKDRDALSGGMAKRVAIARAIAIDPALIFYDEPTTGLDPVISGQIHELVFNMHHRPRADGSPRTSIIVTHDKELLRRIKPRVLMLYEGRIAFDGPYEEFEAAKDGPAREYLQAMPVLHARL